MKKIEEPVDSVSTLKEEVQSYALVIEETRNAK